MKILITGATGFIGQSLTRLLASEHQLLLLSRNPDNARQMFNDCPNIQVIRQLTELTDLNQIDAIINLAGEPIIGKRWTKGQKHRLCHSRWDLTAQLSEMIKRASTPPKVFISASAVGVYGVHQQEKLHEQSAPNPDFAHSICSRWEALALSAQSDQTRVCIARIGIVLGKNGGALAKMLPAFKMGLGGPIGHGQQGMSWIHLDDLLSLLLFLLNTPTAQGVFNAVAPSPVSNREFSQALGRALKRPAFLPAPAIALKLALGESAMLLTEGQYVVPQHALDAGFSFRYARLEDALNEITT